MAWTPEQQAAIDSRGQTLLLSAAAGSGKTAVLVERIIRRLLDKDKMCIRDSLPSVPTFPFRGARRLPTTTGCVLSPHPSVREGFYIRTGTYPILL